MARVPIGPIAMTDIENVIYPKTNSLVKLFSNSPLEDFDQLYEKEPGDWMSEYQNFIGDQIEGDGNFNFYFVESERNVQIYSRENWSLISYPSFCNSVTKVNSTTLHIEVNKNIITADRSEYIILQNGDSSTGLLVFQQRYPTFSIGQSARLVPKEGEEFVLTVNNNVADYTYSITYTDPEYVNWVNVINKTSNSLTIRVDPRNQTGNSICDIKVMNELAEPDPDDLNLKSTLRITQNGLVPTILIEPDPLVFPAESKGISDEKILYVNSNSSGWSYNVTGSSPSSFTVVKSEPYKLSVYPNDDNQSQNFKNCIVTVTNGSATPAIANVSQLPASIVSITSSDPTYFEWNKTGSNKFFTVAATSNKMIETTSSTLLYIEDSIVGGPNYVVKYRVLSSNPYSTERSTVLTIESEDGKANDSISVRQRPAPPEIQLEYYSANREWDYSGVIDVKVTVNTADGIGNWDFTNDIPSWFTVTRADVSGPISYLRIDMSVNNNATGADNFKTHDIKVNYSNNNGQHTQEIFTLSQDSGPFIFSPVDELYFARDAAVENGFSPTINFGDITVTYTTISWLSKISSGNDIPIEFITAAYNSNLAPRQTSVTVTNDLDPTHATKTVNLIQLGVPPTLEVYAEDNITVVSEYTLDWDIAENDNRFIMLRVESNDPNWTFTYADEWLWGERYDNGGVSYIKLASNNKNDNTGSYDNSRNQGLSFWNTGGYSDVEFPFMVNQLSGPFIFVQYGPSILGENATGIFSISVYSNYATETYDTTSPSWFNYDRKEVLSEYTTLFWYKDLTANTAFESRDFTVKFRCTDHNSATTTYKVEQAGAPKVFNLSSSSETFGRLNEWGSCYAHTIDIDSNATSFAFSSTDENTGKGEMSVANTKMIVYPTANNGTGDWRNTTITITATYSDSTTEAKTVKIKHHGQTSSTITPDPTLKTWAYNSNSTQTFGIQSTITNQLNASNLTPLTFSLDAAATVWADVVQDPAGSVVIKVTPKAKNYSFTEDTGNLIINDCNGGISESIPLTHSAQPKQYDVTAYDGDPFIIPVSNYLGSCNKKTIFSIAHNADTVTVTPKSGDTWLNVSDEGNGYWSAYSLASNTTNNDIISYVRVAFHWNSDNSDQNVDFGVNFKGTEGSFTPSETTLTWDWDDINVTKSTTITNNFYYPDGFTKGSYSMTHDANWLLSAPTNSGNTISIFWSGPVTNEFDERTGTLTIQDCYGSIVGTVNLVNSGKPKTLYFASIDDTIDSDNILGYCNRHHAANLITDADSYAYSSNDSWLSGKRSINSLYVWATEKNTNATARVGSITCTGTWPGGVEESVDFDITQSAIDSYITSDLTSVTWAWSSGGNITNQFLNITTNLGSDYVHGDDFTVVTNSMTPANWLNITRYTTSSRIKLQPDLSGNDTFDDWTGEIEVVDCSGQVSSGAISLSAEGKSKILDLSQTSYDFNYYNVFSSCHETAVCSITHNADSISVSDNKTWLECRYEATNTVEGIVYAYPNASNMDDGYISGTITVTGDYAGADMSDTLSIKQLSHFDYSAASITCSHQFTPGTWTVITSLSFGPPTNYKMVRVTNDFGQNATSGSYTYGWAGGFGSYFGYDDSGTDLKIFPLLTHPGDWTVWTDTLYIYDCNSQVVTSLSLSQSK